MAKRKDDFSFGFTSKKKDSPKKKTEETPAEEAPADASADPFATPDASADPFASTDTPADASADPFASTDTSSSDPFASTDTSSADPFASTDTASSDPFASTDTSSADPFASTDTPADASADPFATPDASADPFASTDTPSDTSSESPAEEAPAEEAPAEKAPSKSPQIKEHKQFRILVLGDFSGRANRQLMETGDAVASRKVHTVDSDSLDRTFAKVKPKILLPVSDTSSVTLEFNAMEDFRPDSLLGRMAGFQAMLKMRSDLQNAKTFKAAAAALKKATGEKKAKPAKPAAKGATGGSSEFESLLNQPVTAKNSANASADALIASLVAGYEVPEADPEQAKMVKLSEDALSAGLRAVLRHPAFQAIESSWRGVEFLVSRLNTDEDLKICLFDISKDELYADLNSSPVLAQTGLYRILIEQTKVPGVEPFALVVGNYAFEQQPKDIGLLAKLAALMHDANIPFVAAATPKVAGFPSFSKFPDSGKWQAPADIAIWDKIRGHKSAAHIGLAAPRFLGRLPYGPKTDAIDTYPFEEMPGAPVMDGYLWLNGAFAVALAMGEGFLESGWEFDPTHDITDLPCHMAVVDGDKEMTPCAEGWLSDRIGDVLAKLGLMPLLSVRNAASVKLAGVHSIAKDGKSLAAAWAKA